MGRLARGPGPRERRGDVLSRSERRYRRNLAAMRAKMEADVEALLRETWEANAPVRAAARLLAREMWPEAASC